MPFNAKRNYEIPQLISQLQNLLGITGCSTLNDYSVPHHYVRRTLVVSASLSTVRILDADAVLATHRRSFDRGQQIEDPAHIEELERHKRLAREHRATDRLHHAAPSAKALFVAAAERNHHLGVLARGLIELLNAHGPVALECHLDGAQLGVGSEPETMRRCSTVMNTARSTSK